MEDHLQHDAYHEDPGFTSDDLEPRAFTPPPRHRILWTLAVLVVLGLLAIVPPLVHVNRFQRQIAASISQSLGRPVHTGEVTLNLLPFPGFTIQNFVVSDDPAFSAEPVIRANSVMARLRWRSLWHRRVEFSRITLSDASVNLVRREDGQWNLESILLQASRMPAAPTAQRGPGDRPRFPYIEATGARVNFKMGLEKLPVSLTEADFALWLPQAEQWHVRLEAHPARTDASVTDTGVLRLEGTLGRAEHLAQVPVDLHASWTAAPLGAASAVLTGRDTGFRGELTFDATLQGTAGNSAFATHLQLDRVRRADFVPARLMDVDLSCTARALGNLHRLEDLHCVWPTGSVNSGLIVTGEVPDTLDPATAKLEATVTALPASALLDAARLLTPRISPDLTLAGTVAAHFTCCTPGQWLSGGDFKIAQAVLSADTTPFYTGDLSAISPGAGITLGPLALDLGGLKPVQLQATFSANDYSLSLEGPAHRDRLTTLAAALPLLGDILPEAPTTTPTASAPDAVPVSQDVNLSRTASGHWGDPFVWDETKATHPPAPPRKHRR